MVFGGTAGDTIYAGDGNDLVFGDHGEVNGDVDPAYLPMNMPAHPFVFTSIFTQNIDGGGNDTIFGEGGEDILIGGQGSDTIYGGADDDDLIGGHNVPGGHDGNDAIDGGAGNDAIAGDNASILRTGILFDPRMRALSGETIYDGDGNPQVTGDWQENSTGVVGRNIIIYDHSENPLPGTWGIENIAGGSGDDLIFGQFGDDVIQGDGSIDIDLAANGASVEDIDGTGTDGDDYIEGGGGNDLIFGNLGQDDIIGGSSSLFGLVTPDLRPDGADTIYGGAGPDIARNDPGDESSQGHARDADVILGDNGNIFRLVGTNGISSGSFLTFNYDNYDTSLTIIPRAVELLDYTLGGSDSDLGTADLIHGEAGDDTIHGQSGNDVIFGEGQDDDIYGGVGHDRLYGGTGEDGILGDDGKILTSRNGYAETLNGLFEANQQTTYSLPGPFTGVVEYITGRLLKTADMMAWDIGGNDVIYGGLGDDFLHGAQGDDAISGAEALPEFYTDAPQTNINPLEYDPMTTKFAAYDADNPLAKIDGFLLNFEATDADGNKIEDGKDRIFGDLGNDWLVGGTGRDRLFGGMGDDLMNADDNLDTNGGLNDVPDDPEFADGDFAFGGGGRDVLIANTGNDRLFDWLGEFNSFIVPFSPFGSPTVNRMPSPHVQQFMLDLGRASGADQTLTEPNGELGLVTHSDPEWSDQHGGPRDPQPGNSKAKRDTQGSPEDDSTAAAAILSSITGDSGSIDLSATGGTETSGDVLGAMESSSPWLQDFVGDLAEGDGSANSNDGISVTLPGDDDQTASQDDTNSNAVVEELLDGDLSNDDIPTVAGGNGNGQGKGKKGK
jgi:Ca2+-binding RTX toxin-like protein